MSNQSLKDVSIDDIPRPVKTYHNQTYDRIEPCKTSFDAHGKTVLITAGATGVGLSISRAFAEAGVARIIIVSRRPEPKAKSKAELEAKYPNTKVETVSCSVTDHADMAQLLQQAGDIDVLVLCAAATHVRTKSIDISLEQTQEVFDTNVVAAYHLLQTFLRLTPPASGTRTIINVSSGSSHVYIPTQTSYAASKAAFNQIMSFFAAEHTPEKDGVRMFSIHPGVFYTEQVAKTYAADAANWEDIDLPGNFCVWLASPEADFLHGRFVWAQWDVDELIAAKERVEKDGMFLKIGLIV